MLLGPVRAPPLARAMTPGCHSLFRRVAVHKRFWRPQECLSLISAAEMDKKEAELQASGHEETQCSTHGATHGAVLRMVLVSMTVGAYATPCSTCPSVSCLQGASGKGVGKEAVHRYLAPSFTFE